MGQKRPRKLSLVKFEDKRFREKGSRKNPFKQGRPYVFLGENVPGHCIVADHRTGRVYSGFHTENFVELSEDEV